MLLCSVLIVETDYLVLRVVSGSTVSTTISFVGANVLFLWMGGGVAIELIDRLLEPFNDDIGFSL